MSGTPPTAFAAKLALHLAGKGVTAENIRRMVRGVIGELGEDPDDFDVIVPFLVVDKRIKLGPGDSHGILIGFDGRPARLLNKQGLIDARAVAEPVIVPDLLWRRGPNGEDPTCR